MHVADKNHEDSREIRSACAVRFTGVGSLHDFFPKPHRIDRGPVTFDRSTNTWLPRFNVADSGFTDHTVSPYDFATIYNLLPLWNEGFTGKGVTIATVEDTDIANTADWSTFRSTFGLAKFTQGNFKQIFPNCKNPGANGDEIEAALTWNGRARPRQTRISSYPHAAIRRRLPASISQSRIELHHPPASSPIATASAKR